MSAPTPAAPSPAELYDSVYVPAIFDRVAPLLLQRAAPRAGETVLDLACGTGIVARSLAPLVGPGGRIVALDLRPGMLAVGRARAAPSGAAIEWKQGDALALELTDDSFDLVVCQQGLQFFPDRPGALREARRVLRSGGRIALAVWQSLESHPIFAELAEVEVRHLSALGVTPEDAGAPFSLGSRDALESTLEQGGFEGIEIAPARITARFPSAASFIRDIEYPYSAFMPQFVQDPPQFDAFVEAVARETGALVERYRVGDAVEFPMHTHIATATA
ncbi:MAG: methyltransferase domain-containing protein [Polyangiaceae bacterium]|nr:methyltransferase domain-containing protein [Polyangiaceae bacterium]